jgi:hypothetical protein
MYMHMRAIAESALQIEAFEAYSPSEKLTCGILSAPAAL